MQPNIKANTLRDYLKIIFRHKIVFLILVLAIIVPVYITLQMITPVYQTSVKMFVKGFQQKQAEYYKEVISSSITADHAELVKSNIVLARVVEALKLYEIPIDYEKRFASPLKAILIEKRMKESRSQIEAMKPEQRKNILFSSAMDDLKGSISISPVRDTSFFEIQVTGYDPGLIPRIANSLSRSYAIFDLEQQIQEYKLKYGEKHSTVLQLENYIEELKKTLDGRIISDIEAIGPASVKIIEQSHSSTPLRRLNAPFLLVVSVFAGIFFSIIFAFMFEYFDETVKSSNDIESSLHVPFLGSVPRKKRRDNVLISHNNSGSKYTKSLEELSNQIYLMMNERRLKVTIFSDAEGSDEASVFIANIGMYLAGHAGQRVLIIDANLRKPDISHVLDIANEPGLSNVLEKEIYFENAVQSMGSHLNVLSAGKVVSNPTVLLKSAVMSDMINKAREVYDLVFIKCADIKNYPDSVLLSSVVDGIILLVNEGKVRKQVISQAIVPLQQNKSNLMGVVLNNCNYVIPEFIYRIA